ncbi:MAG: hypothetical protein ACSLFH_02400 [Desulfuromonadales bacterium]
MMNPRSAPACILLKVLLALSFLVAGVSPAFCLDSAQQSAIEQGLPNEYGRVIFQKNQDATNQIFIIGQSHRSGVNGKNGQHTVQAQMEIYRIGEWLIRQKKVELLLPEGFFQKGVVQNDAQDRPYANYAPDTLDSERLRSMLQDTRQFVSADTLLSDQYPLRLGQVEDEELYQTVSQLMRKLGNRNKDLNRANFEELNDYQRKRTAIMLRNIPFAVESVFQRGDIENKHAIFTIGIAHIADILEFFHAKTGKIAGNDDLLSSAAFDFLEEGYGVTVILPKSLAEDGNVLRLTRLEQFASP